MLVWCLQVDVDAGLARRHDEGVRLLPLVVQAVARRDDARALVDAEPGRVAVHQSVRHARLLVQVDRLRTPRQHQHPPADTTQTSTSTWRRHANINICLPTPREHRHPPAGTTRTSTSACRYHASIRQHPPADTTPTSTSACRYHGKISSDNHTHAPKMARTVVNPCHCPEHPCTASDTGPDSRAQPMTMILTAVHSR